MKSIIGTGDASVRLRLASCSTTVVSQSCAAELLAHGHVGLAHAGADDRPVAVAPGVEEVVEIDRLMGAMKIADADMDECPR